MKKIFRLAAVVLAAFSLVGTLSSCDDNKPDQEPTEIIPSKIIVYAGTTETYPISDPTDKYTSEKGTYYFTYNVDDQTASLAINNADFLQGMPELGVMTFPEISWIAKDKAIVLKKDALTPEIAGRPFPAFPISDFNATEKIGESLSISFICDYRGVPYQVTFSGTPSK